MSADPKFNYHRHLADIFKEDHDHILKKDESYGASWQQRGGVGAFMMLARKWDRLENILKQSFRYDIFAGAYSDMSGADGSILAEVRDLRRYLALVEAKVLETGRIIPKIDTTIDGEMEERLVPRPVPVEDSNKHADRKSDIDTMGRVFLAAGEKPFFANDTVAYTGHGDGSPRRLQDYIQISTYQQLSHIMKGRYIRIGVDGQHYALRRKSMIMEDRSVFVGRADDIGSSTYNALSDWLKPMYEANGREQGSYILKPDFQN